MSAWIYLLGFILGVGTGIGATMSWHHRQLAAGFRLLAERSADHRVTAVDVIEAFGSGRGKR